MTPQPHRWARGWDALDARGRRHASALVAIGLVFVAHTLIYTLISPFFIEDAGISFAYARNLVEGEGLVAYPGGERVEGYSNASWTFLIAALYAVGVPTWAGAKVLGALFGLATLPFAYRLVEEARGRRDEDLPLLAPLLLALSPQFVLWAASGLENSLFCLLLASGSARLLHELREGGARPWSGLLFFGLSATRPEGLAYAFIAGFALLLDAAATRRLRPLIGFGLALALPWAAYNAIRISYFAWPFPNTYYAKLGKGTTFKPYAFDTGGWKYLQRYLLEHAVGFLFPAFALAAAGKRRFALALTVALSAFLGVTVLWDGKAGLDALDIDGLTAALRPITRDWMKLRAWSIAGALGLLGLASLGTTGWRARGLLWAMGCFGGFFALYSGGDWMKGHRWINLISVPLFVLLTVGLGEIDDRVLAPLRGRPGLLGERLRLAVVLLSIGAFGANELRHAVGHGLAPDTGVRDVHRRVEYMAWAQRRLDLDHITLLDVDMGAHLLYSGWEIVDIAGLVDVPMARHSDFNRKFLQQYLMSERVPDMAHMHGGWATSSKIPQLKGWRDQYIEIDPYLIGGRSTHVGNHVRKDTFVFRGGDGPTPDPVPVRFEGGVQLLRVAAPAPEVAPGGELFVETLWKAGLRKTDFSVLVFMDDGAGHRTSQSYPTGYGWYPSTKWGLAEQVESKLRLPIPADLPAGRYRLGIALIDTATGAVLAEAPETQVVDGVLAPRPLPDRGPGAFLPGAFLSGLEIAVVSPAAAQQTADRRRAEALALLAAGDCAAGWQRWKDASRHVLDQLDWIADGTRATRSALADCYVASAAATEDRDQKVRLLALARREDRHAPGIAAAVGPLADTLVAEAEAAAAAHDWEGAYARYRDALRIDPSRAWARRAAEEARDNALRITPPGRVRDEMPWFLDERQRAPADGAEGSPDPDEREIKDKGDEAPPAAAADGEG